MALGQEPKPCLHLRARRRIEGGGRQRARTLERHERPPLTRRTRTHGDRLQARRAEVLGLGPRRAMEGAARRLLLGPRRPRPTSGSGTPRTPHCAHAGQRRSQGRTKHLHGARARRTGATYLRRRCAPRAPRGSPCDRRCCAPSRATPRARPRLRRWRGSRCKSLEYRTRPGTGGRPSSRGGGRPFGRALSGPCAPKAIWAGARIWPRRTRSWRRGPVPWRKPGRPPVASAWAASQPLKPAPIEPRLTLLARAASSGPSPSPPPPPSRCRAPSRPARRGMRRRPPRQARRRQVPPLKPASMANRFRLCQWARLVCTSLSLPRQVRILLRLWISHHQVPTQPPRRRPLLQPASLRPISSRHRAPSSFPPRRTRVTLRASPAHRCALRALNPRSRPQRRVQKRRGRTRARFRTCQAPGSRRRRRV